MSASIPIRLLVVEDSPLDAELEIRELRRSGFAPDWKRVETEETFLQEVYGQWDAVLSDYQLPQFSGPRALALLKQSGVDLPLIVVSGTIGEETAVEMIRGGAADYLLKDRLARLGPALKHAIEEAKLHRERRVTEERIRLRERALAEVSQGVLISDENRKIIYANESFSKISGYAPGEILGKSCAVLQGPQTDPETILRIRAALNAGETFEGEILNYRKDGCPFWNELSIAPIRGGRGAPIRFIGIQRDITARKQAQRALEVSEANVRQERALLRALIDSIPDLIFFKDTGSVFRGCNLAFERLLGIREVELVGLTDFDVVPGGVAEGFRSKDQELMRTGESLRLEEWIPFRQGGGGYFETIKTPFFGPKGESLGVIGVSRDITERRRAVEQSLALLDRLQIAAKASQAGIWEVDLITGMVSWDEPMFTLYGLPPETSALSIEQWFDRIQEEDRAGCRTILDEYRQSDRNFCDTEFHIARASDGEVRLIRSMGMARRDENGKAVRLVGVNRDVTEEKARETELAKALAQEKQYAEQARAGDRAKSEFLAVMSHEVRTPMNGILGFAELLTHAGELSPESRGYAETILQSGEALLRILDDILDFSRLEAGRMQIESVPFSPREMLGQIRRLLEPKATEKGLELQFEMEPQMPGRLIGDAGRLRQVLLNLAGNAIKFSERGRIIVAARQVSGEPEFAFSVKDSGPGISPDQQERIFQPFTQADSSISRRYGGTGLGLSISRRLVELLGGKLTVASRVGEGSEFVARIPFKPVEEPVPVESVAASHPLDRTFAHSHPHQILLVEDDRINLKLIQALMRRLGYEPFIASNGREAVEAFRREHPDCILMDLQMPEMDGVEATEKIRTLETSFGLATRAFICALTANVIPADRERCFAVGMNAYLNKPVKITALAEVLAGAAPALSR